jgi:catechol 2,3-dioxygenase-like lactoylglutathione lyase family enzyme
MLEFYHGLLGLPVRHTSARETTDAAFQAVVGLKDAAYRGAWLRGGNVIVEFFQFTRPVGQSVEVRPACDAGLRHICFDVTNMHSEYKRLKASGVTFLSEPQALAGGTVLSVYARDPEGNMVELQEILSTSDLERISTFTPLH